MPVTPCSPSVPVLFLGRLKAQPGAADGMVTTQCRGDVAQRRCSEWAREAGKSCSDGTQGEGNAGELTPARTLLRGGDEPHRAQGEPPTWSLLSMQTRGHHEPCVHCGVTSSGQVSQLWSRYAARGVTGGLWSQAVQRGWSGCPGEGYAAQGANHPCFIKAKSQQGFIAS